MEGIRLASAHDEGGAASLERDHRHRLDVLARAHAHAARHPTPGHAMPARYTPIVLHTFAYVVLAIGLVVVDRAARREPQPEAS